MPRKKAPTPPPAGPAGPPSGSAPQWTPPRPAAGVVKPMTLAEIAAASPPPPMPSVPPTTIVSAGPGGAAAAVAVPLPPPAPPPATMQPAELQLSVEKVTTAKRPTIRVHGYDQSVANFVHRARQIESENMNQEEGKKWFRHTAVGLRKQFAADNILFASAAGPVEVAFTEARRALDDALLSGMVTLPRVLDLLETEDSLDVRDVGMGILDRAFLQDAKGDWYSLRQALSGGYPGLTLKRTTKLREDFRERLAAMGPTVSEEERSAIEQLEAAGLNAPQVKVPGK